MKKRNIGLFFIFAIFFSMLVYADENNITSANVTKEKVCKDTDFGENYYVKGTVSPYCGEANPEGERPTCGAWIDKCINESVLLEYSCSHLDGIEYNCPYGCKEGACQHAIQNTSTTAVEGGTNSSSSQGRGTGSSNSQTGGTSSSKGISEITVSKSSTSQDTYIIDNKNTKTIVSGVVSVENSKMYMETRKGKEEIKVMPETASETAIQRLGELGFNITLKETGNDKIVYNLEAEKEGKMPGLFNVKGKVGIEIDAKSGEVIKVNKHWWAFMASGI